MITQEQELIRAGVSPRRARTAVRAGIAGFTDDQAALVDADLTTVH